MSDPITLSDIKTLRESGLLDRLYQNGHIGHKTVCAFMAKEYVAARKFAAKTELVRELAASFHVSESTIYRWLAS